MVLLLYILGLWGALIKTFGMFTIITLVLAYVLHCYFLRSQSHTTKGQKQAEDTVEQDGKAVEREPTTSTSRPETTKVLGGLQAPEQESELCS